MLPNAKIVSNGLSGFEPQIERDFTKSEMIARASLTKLNHCIQAGGQNQ
jgi:hypothetical protein